jgi:hypothetical protein
MGIFTALAGKLKLAMLVPALFPKDEECGLLLRELHPVDH